MSQNGTSLVTERVKTVNGDGCREIKPFFYIHIGPRIPVGCTTSCEWAPIVQLGGLFSQ